MEIKFESNLPHQLEAVNSIVNLFEGQTKDDGTFHFTNYEDNNFQWFNGINGIKNILIITEKQIYENLCKIQQENKLPITPEEDFNNNGLNFTVEMETGTGKTYTYLRTIYELNKKYGFKKFVIVVPSIAIREGVLKNLEITSEHFKKLYDNVPVNYYVYDSKKVSILRSFAANNNIEILVINIDSFAKDENIINRPNDKLSGNEPIKFVQKTNPIVIVDEPQNMETEKRNKAIKSLNPLFTIRYSATHRNLYNLVYKLDPIKAYDLGLVKQIEVDSVVEENTYNGNYIEVQEIKSYKTKVTAKLTIYYNYNNGIKKKSVTVKVGDDLYKLSNNYNLYREGFIVEEIDVVNQAITFSSGMTLTSGMSIGELKERLMHSQIQLTIKEHLKKELKLLNRGIKVLSLFFIDRVANYRSYAEDGSIIQKGKIAQWFEEIYKNCINEPEFSKLKEKFHPDGNIDFDKIHNGYFSQDKKGRPKDTKGESEDDLNTYNLIMKDKEKLLDLHNPLRFIFSHTALREGWDNPNVFQICTLNEAKSDIKKRQEIGRGLRLAVDQEGKRIYDKNINCLTIIANESYETFAKQLQIEIEEECGVKFEGRIKNKRDRVDIKYRKGFEVDPKFLEIWEKIKYKTRYSVEYETGNLIEEASKAIKQLPKVDSPSIRFTKVKIDIPTEGIDTSILSVKKEIYNNKHFIVPDILEYIQQKTELTRNTITKILEKAQRWDDFFINPQYFCDQCVSVIKKTLIDLMVDGIKYEKIENDFYEMRLFKAQELESYLDNLLYQVQKPDKTIYEKYIPIDSNVESKFAKDCETSEQVEFYFKLPPWFKISTPIGNYNPDWAVVFKDEKKIYFVAETKDTGDDKLNISKLHLDEQRKIKCGEKHYEVFDDVRYKVVKEVHDLI
ncbi:MAG: DEAD/DEAH box helicase family protein [Thermoplasmata archaeon]